jgi:hypothetical protein
VALRSGGGGFVLLDHAGRDAPAPADRDAVVFHPRPDVAAALPARCGPRRPAARTAAGLAGVVDVGRDLLAEGGGVLRAEVDLVVGAVEPEPQRLVGWAAVKVVFEFDSDPLCRWSLRDLRPDICTVQDQPSRRDQPAFYAPTRIAAPSQRGLGLGWRGNERVGA